MRLSIDTIRAELDFVDFRFPGFSFELYEHPWEGWWICIRFTAVDVYNPEDVQVQNVRSPLPPFQTLQQFHTWMIWRLLRIAMHETREAYWVHGSIYDDPHAEDDHRPGQVA